MRAGSIFQASSPGKSCAGHFGDFNPAKPTGFWLTGLGPRNIVSMRSRVSTATVERNSVSGGVFGEKLTSAETPSASPALRIMGCSIEASYCAHRNHGAVQIGGKLTGASWGGRVFLSPP